MTTIPKLALPILLLQRAYDQLELRLDDALACGSLILVLPDGRELDVTAVVFRADDTAGLDQFVTIFDCGVGAQMHDECGGTVDIHDTTLGEAERLSQAQLPRYFDFVRQGDGWRNPPSAPAPGDPDWWD